MKGFRFRLGRVLRVRRLEEQLARATFLDHQATARQASEHSAEGADLALRMQTDLARQVAAGPLEPRLVITSHRSLADMHRICASRRERARTLALQAEQARVPWSELRAEVRALEVLEQRKRDRFRSEEEKRANRELDETAARRARKNRSSPGPRNPSRRKR